MIKIGIHGALGKMGKEVATVISHQNNCDLAYSYSKTQGNLHTLCLLSDIIIDFSAPDAVIALIDEALKTQTKLVIGTTGFTQEHHTKMLEASKKIAIFYSPNMSIGIALLNMLANKADLILQDYEVDILDIHHANKKDAPSGTALMLGQNISKVRNVDFVKHDHINGSRPNGAIGFCSIRSGNALAENQVMLTGSGESIILSHKAQNRNIFASGALTAALRLSLMQPGLYGMKDILHLEPL